MSPFWWSTSRNCAGPRMRQRSGVSARTVALRGPLSRRAISPKKSPGPSSRFRFGASTSTRPSTMTKKAPPLSPRLESTFPAGRSTSSARVAMKASSLSVQPEKSGTLRSSFTLGSAIRREASAPPSSVPAALVVVDPPPAPVADLATAAATGRAGGGLREDVGGGAEDEPGDGAEVVRAHERRGGLAGGGGEADEEEPPVRRLLRHPAPSRCTNEASRAHPPHTTSSSFVTQPLRIARRSSSRSVVSSISGPSVLNEKRTLCFLNVAMYSPSSSASLTTFVSRFDDGQISRRTPRSARRLQRSRSCAAWMP